MNSTKELAVEHLLRDMRVEDAAFELERAGQVRCARLLRVLAEAMQDEIDEREAQIDKLRGELHEAEREALAHDGAAVDAAPHLRAAQRMAMVFAGKFDDRSAREVLDEIAEQIDIARELLGV